MQADPQARHPAKPRGRHAVDQRVRAHLPVRHAARHALLHARQRVVAGRLRARIGATTRVIRLAPVHRALPPPAAAADGTHILSHDQIEAVLMRRAGYEVRVLPEEGASWEENPPTLLEFIRRDLRWARATCSTGRILVMPGLKPVSRYQIAFAMLMFLGSPGLDRPAGARHARGRHCRARRTSSAPDAGMALFVITLIMWFAPKIATVIDVVSRPALRRSFGGAARFIASVGHRDDLLPPALADHVVSATRMFLAGLRARPHDRLGRAGARRSCGAVERCGAAALAAHAARLELHPACSPSRCRRRSPTRCSSPAGPRCRSRSPSSRRGRRSAAR